MVKSVLNRVFRHGIQLMLVGIITGILAGIIVSFYNISADFVSKYSKNIYAGIRNAPYFIPLLFVVLGIFAFVISVVQQFIPIARGSGIPQTEGATRGLMELKWYKSLPTMAALSLLSIFGGLTAGSEGPSMVIGASCGDGISKLFKTSDIDRRYQLTGGACAGLAVAFNAPLTGVVFAVEEAHRRFTPAIFICAFSSVLSGVITRNALLTLLGMPITTSLTRFTLFNMPLKTYGFVVLSAFCTGILGVLFYTLSLKTKKLLSKINLHKNFGRLLFPFMLAGVFGLISVSVMGGGHSLIESLGTNGGLHEANIEQIFSSPIVVSLLLILVMRFITTILNVGAGVPCGIFIPMLAIGALAGTLLSKLCLVIGMDSQFCDCIVLICMATFFASIVKAPLTAVIMVVELTGQFTLLAPVILGVSVGYMISEVFGFKPFYDQLLEDILEESEVKVELHTYETVLERNSVAENKAIRDILWPCNLLVSKIERNGNKIVPASDTVLFVGDILTIQAECLDPNQFERWVDEIVKAKKPIFKRKNIK